MDKETKVELGCSCQNCIFRIFEGNAQSGCRLNRLDKFQATNTIIQKTINKEDGTTHFVLMDRNCNGKRTEEWSKYHQELGIITNEAEELDVVYEELKVRCALFVILNGDKGLSDLEKTLESANAQSIPFNHYIVLINNGVKSSDAIKTLKDTLPQNAHYLWDVGRNTEKYTPDVYRNLDKNVHRIKKSGWYTVFQAGQSIPGNFTENLNIALNFNLARFSLLLPYDEDCNGLTVQTAVHQAKAFADMIGSIVSKIYKYAEEADKPYLIERVESICPRQQAESESLSPVTTTPIGSVVPYLL